MYHTLSVELRAHVEKWHSLGHLYSLSTLTQSERWCAHRHLGDPTQGYGERVSSQFQSESHMYRLKNTHEVLVLQLHIHIIYDAKDSLLRTYGILQYCIHLQCLEHYKVTFKYFVEYL